MPQVVLEGTWEEVAQHAPELSGKRVRLLVLDEAATGAAHSPLFLTATPEEFRAAFDALGGGNRDAPVLPPEAFERESLYEGDEERW
jgi:hypothetical protein